MRKHRDQMNAPEIAAIESRIRELSNPDWAGHAAERMGSRNVNAAEILNTIKWGIVIEIHNDAGELRALVRHAFGRPKVAVCIVVSLETGHICTVWKNRGSDNHQTLDRSLYTWRENVVQILSRMPA